MPAGLPRRHHDQSHLGLGHECARNVTADLCDAGIGVTSLPCDRDAKFGLGFDTVWQGEGARVLRIPVRAPQRKCHL